MDNANRWFFFQTISPDTETEVFKVAQEYLGDKSSLDEAMSKMEDIAERAVDKKIRQHPEWKAEKW